MNKFVLAVIVIIVLVGAYFLFVQNTKLDIEENPVCDCLPKEISEAPLATCYKEIEDTMFLDEESAQKLMDAGIEVSKNENGEYEAKGVERNAYHAIYKSGEGPLLNAMINYYDDTEKNELERKIEGIIGFSFDPSKVNVSEYYGSETNESNLVTFETNGYLVFGRVSGNNIHLMGVKENKAFSIVGATTENPEKFVKELVKCF